MENVLIVNINLKCDAKTPPCSKTTQKKKKKRARGGGNHTNEISILKFWFRKLKKITLVSMFRAWKVLCRAYTRDFCQLNINFNLKHYIIVWTIIWDLIKWNFLHPSFIFPLFVWYAEFGNPATIGCTLLIQFPIPKRVKWGWENHSYLHCPIFNRSSLTFILQMRVRSLK